MKKMKKILQIDKMNELIKLNKLIKFYLSNNDSHHGHNNKAIP